MPFIKTCPICGKEYKATYSSSKFCSLNCRNISYKKERITFGTWKILKFSHREGSKFFYFCQFEDEESPVIVDVYALPYYKKLKNVYRGIKHRCNLPNNSAYKNYGGRGIKMCEEWEKDFTLFYNWAIASGYEEGLTVERIDFNGNYCPENCKWIPFKEQNQNKRTSFMITINNETHCLNEWCRILKIHPNTLWNRIRRSHWSIEKALTTPINHRKVETP